MSKATATENTEVPSRVIKEAVEREARDDGRRHLHLHEMVPPKWWLKAVEGG